MATKPIIFKAHDVRALMTCAHCGHIGPGFPCAKCGSDEFLKNQTRRPVNLQRIPWELRVSKAAKQWERFAPYQPGDVLWVREQIRITGAGDDGEPLWEPPVWYMSDGQCQDIEAYPFSRTERNMPEWAARLFAQVTDVRAQRIQEISEEDALAEGAAPNPCGGCGASDPNDRCIGCLHPFYAEGFKILWDSLAKPGIKFADNPWVYAYTFERCAKPEGWPDA